jgi:hypothetical protein
MIGRSAIIVYRKPMPAAAISTNSLLTAGSRTCCAASRHCAAQLRYKALLKGSPFLAEKPVGNPQRAVLAPIQAFSRRPLSPGYRALTGPSLKGSNGSAPADVSRTAKWLLLPHSSHCQTPARRFCRSLAPFTRSTPPHSTVVAGSPNYSTAKTVVEPDLEPEK